MTSAKLHHYVPQFHLRRFADPLGRVWSWDKKSDRVFAVAPKGIAAESNFYFLSEFLKHDHDPLTMEKQLADLEGQTALITNQWLGWIEQIELGDQIEIPEINREIVSLYIALQFLRTADTRDTLSALADEDRKPMPDSEKRRVHTELLWDEPVFRGLADRIHRSTWVFGRNSTSTPFVTSDNPVAFRTGDNTMWLKAALYTVGTYVVFPLAPEVVMYCYPDESPFENMSRFDGCLSPVVFTEEMAESGKLRPGFYGVSIRYLAAKRLQAREGIRKYDRH
jgi:hypothetical protein